MDQRMTDLGDNLRLWEGDCRDMLATLPDNSMDSCVTDPPYEIGFMGKTFDKTGIAFDTNLWKEVLRVLKPGAHLCAFAAPRTYHRLACAVEDAGFEIRDQIDWVFTSGMPHGTDVGRLIEKKNPEDACWWDGWNSQLKPAHEPICLARKPLADTLVGNVLAHGTGALHVDACRVPIQPDEYAEYAGRWARTRNPKTKTSGIYGAYSRTDDLGEPGEGRFPPNLLLDEGAARTLDQQSGQQVSRKGKPRASTKPGEGWGMTHTGTEYDDTGGASRSFPIIRYCSKADQQERPVVDGIRHPTVKPVNLMAWLIRLVTPEGGTVLEPFAGSGATLEACIGEGCGCMAAEMEPDYVRLIKARLSKPIDRTLF